MFWALVQDPLQPKKKTNEHKINRQKCKNEKFTILLFFLWNVIFSFFILILATVQVAEVKAEHCLLVLPFKMSQKWQKVKFVQKGFSNELQQKAKFGIRKTS